MEVFWHFFFTVAVANINMRAYNTLASILSIVCALIYLILIIAGERGTICPHFMMRHRKLKEHAQMGWL